MTDIENILIERLVHRDLIESNFKELFKTFLYKPSNSTSGQFGGNNTERENLIDLLKSELRSKDEEISKLKEIIKIMNKDKERVNDELMSANIENNILQERLDSLTKEHDKLIQRWLQRVQIEADKMNAGISS